VAFLYPQKVMFKHCDPAGIVFYPRYFEMINDCVEAFFEDVLALPFSALHKTGGVPTAEITTRFTAPSRLGDILSIRLDVTKLGRSSVGVQIQAECGEQTRFYANSTLVFVNELGKPTSWPAPVREKLEKCLKDDANDT